MLPFLQDLSALYVVCRMVEHPLQKHSKHVNPIGLQWGCTFLLCGIQGRGPTWTGGGKWQASLWPSTQWRWVVGASWARWACHRTHTWGTAAWTLFLSPCATASTTSSTCLASHAKTPIRWGWLWFRLSQFCGCCFYFHATVCGCSFCLFLRWFGRHSWNVLSRRSITLNKQTERFRALYIRWCSWHKGTFSQWKCLHWKIGFVSFLVFCCVKCSHLNIIFVGGVSVSFLLWSVQSMRQDIFYRARL